MLGFVLMQLAGILSDYLIVKVMAVNLSRVEYLNQENLDAISGNHCPQDHGRCLFLFACVSLKEKRLFGCECV